MFFKLLGFLSAIVIEEGRGTRSSVDVLARLSGDYLRL